MIGDAYPEVEWLSDPAPASWIGPRLHSFAHDVGSVVPEGFETYARLFHPVETVEGGIPRRRRWAEVAAAKGRIVHPEMQFHLISRAAGTRPPPGYHRGEGPSWGSLALPERQVLVELLRAGTTTPDRCWFCVWEGYGVLDDRGVEERVRLPHRDYLLYRGPVEAALARLVHPPLDQSPNLWWPDDRSWIVATEVDFAWTYVGGSGHLIEGLRADGRLEALEATPADQISYDSDVLNAALDQPGFTPGGGPWPGRGR